MLADLAYDERDISSPSLFLLLALVQLLELELEQVGEGAACAPGFGPVAVVEGFAALVECPDCALALPFVVVILLDAV